MKYMGSKAALLRGELGSLLVEESQKSSRFVDLFSGSGAVGNYIAENVAIPVLSVDLQRYSQVFSESIIGRYRPQVDGPAVSSWVSSARKALAVDTGYSSLAEPVSDFNEDAVVQDRRLASTISNTGFITRHYGGHYFSVRQAYALDYLYSTLPKQEPHRALSLAALLHTASMCAAAPGHTAQPFQPTTKLLPYIRSAWNRDVLEECQRQVEQISKRHAIVRGEARTGDALEIATELWEDDLVFCDPPYSAVQYSRFYHVLEGIACGGWPNVYGAGRSPERILRPSSGFSMKTKAVSAMSNLLARLRQRSCRVLVTFPDLRASNGLSSSDIVALASGSWKVREQYVESVHSTLGGSGNVGRGSRRSLREAVLLLEPRNAVVSMFKETKEIKPSVYSPGALVAYDTLDAEVSG